MKDVGDEIALSEDELREAVRSLDVMLKSEGWGLVRQILASKSQAHANQLAQMRVATQEEVAAFNHIKGQRLELESFAALPEQLFSDLDTQLKKIMADREAEEEELIDG